MILNKIFDETKDQRIWMNPANSRTKRTLAYTRNLVRSAAEGAVIGIVIGTVVTWVVVAVTADGDAEIDTTVE